MTTIAISNLAKLLSEAYPGQDAQPRDQRLLIRIDDRDQDDIYVGFCSIHLEILRQEVESFQVTMDNVPYDSEVEAVAADINSTWRNTGLGRTLTVLPTVEQTRVIRRLAKAIRQVVRRGNRYVDRNWKWIAPRTASSLERLARVLSRFGKN